MPFKIDFGWDLGGFGEGKWRQVCIKIVSEIDVNFERPIFTKTHKNQWFFNDFFGFGEASWDRKSSKNQLKIDVKFGRHLGIDFWWAWGGKLGGKTEPRGTENQFKNTQKK